MKLIDHLPFRGQGFSLFSLNSSNMTMVDSFEKIPVKIYPDLKAGSKAVAKEIADFIRKKKRKKKNVFSGYRIYS
jgi:glucosamine-6-phosphate deaminase